VPAAGVYTLAVDGLVAGATVVAVDAVELVSTNAASPAAGQFALDASPSRIVLRPPALPAGRHVVRVFVNGVEAPSPAPWFELP
jgi:hypothetical protein